MRDWKADLKKIELKKSQTPEGVDADMAIPYSEDISNYEEFTLAQKRWAAEKGRTIKARDFELVLHLEKRVRYFQRLYQEEVAKYRHAYPNASHEEISKKAHAIRRAEAEKAKKEKLAAAESAAAEEKRLQKEERQLTADAKRLIRDRSLVMCTSCHDGRIESDCATCDGTGQVDPYIYPTIKLVVEGAITRTVKSFETRTKCPEKWCHDGTVFQLCPNCAGLKVCTTSGKPLHKLTRDKKALVARIRELLGLTK